MGFLISILLALASLSMGEVGLETGWQMPALVPLLAPVPYLLGSLESRAGVAGHFRLSMLWHRIGRLAPLVLQFLAVGVLGWSLTVREWLGGELGLTIWPRPAQLLVLAPFVLYSAAAIDADARANTEPGSIRASLRRFQLRMFFAGLVPVALYVGGAALVGEWITLRVWIEEVTLFGTGFTAVLVVLLILLLPRFLRSAWEAHPLPDGPQLELLKGVARIAQFRCRELLVWSTGNLVANAAIVGLTSGSRRVFFSDALLAQLGPRQLAAVYAHEIGHARRHHVPLFLMWAIGYFYGLDLLRGVFGAEQELESGTFLAVGVALWMVGFGWLSRRVELDADLFSLSLLRDGLGITSALLQVARGRRDRGGWRHFSVNRRIEFLGRVVADPDVGARLRRRLGVAWALGALLLAATVIFQVSGMSADLPEERVVVDLRLGRYESAARHLGRVEEPDEGLAELTRLAARTLGVDFATREEAAERCGELADEAGEKDLRLAWLHLAAIAGDEQAERALREQLEAEPPEEE